MAQGLYIQQLKGKHLLQDTAGALTPPTYPGWPEKNRLDDPVKTKARVVSPRHRLAAGVGEVPTTSVASARGHGGTNNPSDYDRRINPISNQPPQT